MDLNQSKSSRYVVLPPENVCTIQFLEADKDRMVVKQSSDQQRQNLASRGALTNTGKNVLERTRRKFWHEMPKQTRKFVDCPLDNNHSITPISLKKRDRCTVQRLHRTVQYVSGDGFSQPAFSTQYAPRRRIEQIHCGSEYTAKQGLVNNKESNNLYGSVNRCTGYKSIKH